MEIIYEADRIQEEFSWMWLPDRMRRANYRGEHYGRNPKWEEICNPNTIGFEKHFQLYHDMITWVYLNIDDCEQVVEWTKIGDGIYFRFWNPNDAMRFRLTWG